jgi:hypothetical protein
MNYSYIRYLSVGVFANYFLKFISLKINKTQNITFWQAFPDGVFNTENNPYSFSHNENATTYLPPPPPNTTLPTQTKFPIRDKKVVFCGS